MISIATMKPMIGDVTIGSTTLGQRPTCLSPSIRDQCSTCQCPSEVASAAPHRPPMSA